MTYYTQYAYLGKWTLRICGGRGECGKLVGASPSLLLPLLDWTLCTARKSLERNFTKLYFSFSHWTAQCKKWFKLTVCWCDIPGCPHNMSVTEIRIALQKSFWYTRPLEFTTIYYCCRRPNWSAANSDKPTNQHGNWGWVKWINNSSSKSKLAVLKHGTHNYDLVIFTSYKSIGAFK